MSDKTEKTDDAAAPKKKGKLMKILMMGGGALLLVGGGVGAGVYAAGSGSAHEEKEEPKGPKLVPKSEQKRAGEGGEEGGHGGGESSGGEHGEATPHGEGGEPYASNYYAMEKDFTANLRDSVHFIQIGIAVSTPYDETVIQNLKTNDIAVRSAILLALGDTAEEEVMSSEGKRKLQRRLAEAINETLKVKEGFGGISNVYFTNLVVQ